MMWAGIAGAVIGAVLLVWAWLRRSQQMGAIEDASEAIGLIEAAERMRDEALKGFAQDEKVFEEAMKNADAARKYIEENADEIKARSTKDVLDSLARWGY